MSVTFIPNVAWQRVAEPEWVVDSWGIATATIKWRGPRPGKEAAENQFQRFASLPLAGFTGMRLNRYKSANATPSFPAIDVEYVGFRGGVPPPMGTPSISNQVIQVNGTDQASGNKFSAQVSYYASRTQWEWWEVGTPSYTTPRYSTVLNQQPPQIDWAQIVNQDPTQGVAASELTAAFNLLIPEIVISDYVVTPIVPNAIYRCTSSVDYKFRAGAST